MASIVCWSSRTSFKASDVYKIVSMIEKAGYLDHVIFISFALKNLISLRRRYPTQPAQYLIKEWDDKLLDTLEKYNLGIDIYYKSATPDNVRKVHALGQEYNVWTVNEAVDGDALVAWGWITSPPTSWRAPTRLNKPNLLKFGRNAA